MIRRSWTDYMAEAARQPPLIDKALLDEAPQPKRRRPGTIKRPVVPERDIQKAILQALSMHPNVARIERINVIAGRLLRKDGKPSRFLRSCRRGRVDIDGFTKDCRVIAIEVKRPETRNDLTDEQMEYLEQVHSAGGLAGVATSVEEAVAIVEGRVELAEIIRACTDRIASKIRWRSKHEK